MACTVQGYDSTWTGTTLAVVWVVSASPEVERVVEKIRLAWKKLPEIVRLTPIPRPILRILQSPQVITIHRMLKHLQAPNCMGGLK